MDVVSLSPVLGRLLIGILFVFFGIWNTLHWSPTRLFMVQKKLPFAAFGLGFGIFLQIIAGFMLIFNLYVKMAVITLIPFTLISVFIFHAFWDHTGELRRLNMIIFITHLTATLGGLLLLL